MSRRVVRTIMVHRHGDRTPITPVGSSDLWKSTLPDAPMLDMLASRFPSTGITRLHSASGTPPYGQLTALGLKQLSKLGRQLRAKMPDITPASTTCHATPFLRTIQSSQALLHGLFSTTSNHDDTTTNYVVQLHYNNTTLVFCTRIPFPTLQHPSYIYQCCAQSSLTSTIVASLVIPQVFLPNRKRK